MQIKSCQTKNDKERWLLIKNFLSTIFCTPLNKTNRKALQVMRTHHAYTLHLLPLPSAVSKVQRSFAFKICNFPQVG